MPALFSLKGKLRIRVPEHILAELVVFDRRVLHHLEMASAEVEAAAAVTVLGAALVIDKVLVAREGGRDLEGVADLASIPSAVGLQRAAEVVVVLLCEVDDPALLNDHLGLFGDGEALFLDRLQPVDVHFEDGDGVFFGKLRVEERDVYPRLYSFVQCAWTVGGEKEDARVILENTEED